MRRTLALAAALLALALAPAPPAAAQQPPASTPAAGRILLVEQPIAVAPDGQFGVLLAIDDAPSATEIAVDIYPRVQPGDAVGVEPDDDPEATFDVVPLADGAGSARRLVGFSIELHAPDQPSPDPTWGYELAEPGAYPIRVRLRDAEGDMGVVLMTTLLRLPEADQEVVRTDAALVVEAHRPPPADPDARAAQDQADADLLAELAPVLDALAARPELAATFSITPETLVRIANDPTAAEDLGRLRSAVEPEGRTVLDAPYVDLDPASLVGNDLADELGIQAALGRQTLAELLEEPVAGTWEVTERVDAATVEQLRARGVVQVILPSDALEGDAGVLAPVDLPAGDAALRAVSASPAFSPGTAAPGDPVLAAHLLLARLAAAGPGPSGTPAVVLSIDPGTVDPETLRIVLDALRFGTPFFAPTSLEAVLDAAPTATAAGLAAVDPPDLGAWPAELRRSRASLASYASMVANRTDLTRPYERQLATSAAAELDLEERRRDASGVEIALQEPFTAISLPARDKITLGARDARFPLPIESSLDYPAQVVIELESNDRLDFPSNRIEATLDSEREVIQIQVRTRTAGDTPVRITVRSPDDGVVLAESIYTIRSTAVSGVGVVLTVGAAGFLALWWGRHWHRNRGTVRHARVRRPPRPSPSSDDASSGL